MRHHYNIATISALLMITACANDATEEVIGGEGKVSVTLSAPLNNLESRAPASAGYTTAAIDPKSELIESYYVVFTKGSGASEEIVQVAKNADVTTGGEGVEECMIDVDLHPGTYKAYAFVNIPFAYLDTKFTVNIGDPLIGQPFDASALAASTYLLPEITTGETFIPIESVESIPMTSTVVETSTPGVYAGQTIEVTERVGQKFGIEVVRMLGKVQFDFRNPTGKALKLSAIGMTDLTLNKGAASPAREGAVLLMNYTPRFTSISDFEAAPVALPADVATGSRRRTLAPAATLPSNPSITLSSAPQFSQSFYVLESLADGATGSFQLDFDLDTDPSSGLGDNMRYALTKPDNFTKIHRGDWMVIPITIGEWVMSLEAFSYPPIGGYPEAKVDGDDSNQFHVAFSSPGDIAFYPSLHKFYAPSEYYYLDSPRFKTASITYTDPDGIFETAPALSTLTGEVTARLLPTKTTTVPACITITVEFYDDPIGNPSHTISYTAKVHVSHV